MNYSESVDWLENIPISFDSDYNNYELKLENVKKFLNHLGNPQTNQRFIHVAGTNGKGSTCHIISSILQEHGYDVGLFSSPHLYDFRERIKINSDYIEKKFVVEFVLKNRKFIKKNKLSFFEISFAVSLCYFKLIKPDFIIIEVGLGGRLDATNVINPILSVITNIGYDHKKFLGNTLTQIAKEKAGIIKNGVDVVIGESNVKLKEVFDVEAIKFKSKVHYADQSKKHFITDLIGDYQIKNINTAIAALNKINDLRIDESIILRGIKNIIKNTNLIGRWQIVGNKPTVVFDIAHNFNSLELVFEQLNSNKGKIRVVFGTLDKLDQLNCLKIFSKNHKYYFCSPNIKRAMPLSKLCAKAKKLNINFSAHSSVKAAYENAITESDENDMILVTGSTYLFSEIKNFHSSY